RLVIDHRSSGDSQPTLLPRAAAGALSREMADATGRLTISAPGIHAAGVVGCRGHHWCPRGVVASCSRVSQRKSSKGGLLVEPATSGPCHSMLCGRQRWQDPLWTQGSAVYKSFRLLPLDWRAHEPDLAPKRRAGGVGFAPAAIP